MNHNIVAHALRVRTVVGVSVGVEKRVSKEIASLKSMSIKTPGEYSTTMYISARNIIFPQILFELTGETNENVYRSNT